MSGNMGTGPMYDARKVTPLPEQIRAALSQYAARYGGRPDKVEVNDKALKAWPLDFVDGVPVEGRRNIASGIIWCVMPQMSHPRAGYEITPPPPPPPGVPAGQ